MQSSITFSFRTFLWLSVGLQAAGSTPPCNAGEGFHVGKDHFVCFLVAVEPTGSLTTRNNRCQHFSAQLASVSDPLIYNYLQSALAVLLPIDALSFIVIGTNDIATETQFVDINGVIQDWAMWGDNRPNPQPTGGSSDCVAISRVYNKKIQQYDYECYHTFNDSLCGREVSFSNTDLRISEAESNMSGSLYTDIGLQVVQTDSKIEELSSVRSVVSCAVVCSRTETCFYFSIDTNSQVCKLFRVTQIIRIEDVNVADYYTIQLWAIRNLG